MGKVDVSELLCDPELVDACILIHRRPFVNQYGQNELFEQGFPTYGVIQPASGKTLARLPELFRVANVQSFWIKGNIVSDGNCAYPDVINFKGSRYAVQIVFDWTSWGDGWAEGTCVRERPALGSNCS